MTARGSVVGNAVRGAVAGGIAVWVMDQVTTGLAASQSKASAAAEKAAAPNGKSSVGNLVDRLVDHFDVELDTASRGRATQAVHYALGIVPGSLYGALRGRVPLVGTALGLGYGAALWAVNDEYANAALGLSGPIDAYPLDTHLRGVVGHLALGLVTDAGIDILGG